MYYTFGETHIWDGSEAIDWSRPKKKIKAKSLERAKRKLPPNELGRKWVLIETTTRNKRA